jgi:catechol 2,3-dioxygenase
LKKTGVEPPGYRLKDGTHVGTVRLQVRDLDIAADYYTRVLGFEARDRAENMLTLGAGGDHPLVVLQAKSGVHRVPRQGVYGLYHFAVLLPERAALGRFAAHLARLGIRAGMADHLVSESLYLTDPDGLGIEVYADRPRSMWGRNGEEFAMSTEPLNIANLIAAGGDSAWTGAPSGTTIGHMHLHVGNLAEAERFYHVALGFDKTVWSYPGALFLSASGYHHHLGTNTWSPGPSATDEQARLLDWELVVPTIEDASGAARSLRETGYEAQAIPGGWIAVDPWGTQLRIVVR